jgi:hypothetical protein
VTHSLSSWWWQVTRRGRAEALHSRQTMSRIKLSNAAQIKVTQTPPPPLYEKHDTTKHHHHHHHHHHRRRRRRRHSYHCQRERIIYNPSFLSSSYPWSQLTCLVIVALTHPPYNPPLNRTRFSSELTSQSSPPLRPPISHHTPTTTTHPPTRR